MKTIENSERNLHFTFRREGFLFAAQNILCLRIDGVKKDPLVGVSRDILIPLHTRLTQYFDFLKSDYDSNSILNYRGIKIGNSREYLVQLSGMYCTEKDESLDKNPILLQALSTSFLKYEDGSLYSSYEWLDSDEGNSQKVRVSLDDFIEGIGVYVDQCRYGIEEYARSGFVYRFLNIPTSICRYELTIGDAIVFKVSMKPKVSDHTKSFCRNVCLEFAQIFDFDDEVLKEINGVLDSLG